MNRLLCSFIVAFLPVMMSAQKMQLGINAVDIMTLGTLNAQFDFAVDRHWTLGLAGKYNPFTYGDERSGGRQLQLRQRSVCLNARWWPWHVYSGWWISGKAQWQEYNMGGLFSDETEEGQKYGGGLSGGYSHMISSHFNLDFGLGVWGGMKKYTLYSCPRCGRRLKDGMEAFFLPSDIIVAITYVF